MKLLTQTSLRFVYIALAALFVCGASVVSAPRAQAYEGDDVFPRIIESASLVFSTIQDRVDADGAELLTQSTSVAQDPQIAALIALLNQLISQYQALLAAQGTNTAPSPTTPTKVTSADGKYTINGPFTFALDAYGVEKEIQITGTAASGIVRVQPKFIGYGGYPASVNVVNGNWTAKVKVSLPGTYTFGLDAGKDKYHFTQKITVTAPATTATAPSTKVDAVKTPTFMYGEGGARTTVGFVKTNTPFTVSGKADGGYMYLQVKKDWLMNSQQDKTRIKINVTNNAWTWNSPGLTQEGHYTFLFYASPTSTKTIGINGILAGTKDPIPEEKVSTGTIAFTSPRTGDVYKIGDTVRIAWDNQNGCTSGFTLKWVHDRNGNASETDGWETGYQVLWHSAESDTIMRRGYYDFKIPSLYNSAVSSAAVYNNAFFIRCSGEGDKSALSNRFRVDASSSNIAIRSTKTDQQLVYGSEGIGSDTLGNIANVLAVYKTQYIPPNGTDKAEEGTTIDFSWNTASALSDDDTYVYLSLIQDTNSDGIYDAARQIAYYNTKLPSGHTNGNYTWTVPKTMNGVNVTGYNSKIVMSNHPLTTISLNPAESEITYSKTFTIHALSTTGTPNPFHIGTLKVTGDGGGSEITTTTRTYAEALTTCANRVKFNPGTISCYFDGVKLNVAGTVGYTSN